MRKFLVFMFIFLFTTSAVFADGDLWDNFGDTNTYGQKAVSEQDFEKALESKQKKNQMEQKKSINTGIFLKIYDVCMGDQDFLEGVTLPKNDDEKINDVKSQRRVISDN